MDVTTRNPGEPAVVVDPELIGARIKELRRKRGLTQQQLAEPHYTHAYISSIESGRRTPSVQAIERLAQKLAVDPDEIRTGRPTNLLPELELELQEARVQISTGDLLGARARFDAVLRTAKKFKTAFQQAKAHEGLGLCLERSGELDAAIDQYALAGRLLADAPPNARADAVAGQARCIELRGDKHHAIYLLETLLESLRRQTLEDPDALIRIYTSLAVIYIEGDFLRKAADAAEEALKLEEHVSDPLRLGAMHNMVARVLLRRGETERAERSIRRAEHFYSLAELRLEMGRARLSRGIFLLRTGSRKKAATDLKTALEIFVEARSPLDEARAATELGRIAREEGRANESARLFDRALNAAEGAQPAQLARIIREKSLAHSPDDRKTAEAGLREAISLFGEAGEPMQAAITYAYLGDVLSDKPLGPACQAYRDGLAILEEQHVS